MKRVIHDRVLEVRDDRGAFLFAVESESEQETLHYKLTGAFQNETTFEFADEVMAALSVCMRAACDPTVDRRFAYKNLIFDLLGITYISNATLQAFLGFQNVINRINGAHMMLLNPSAPVLAQIKDTRFEELLDFRTIV